MAPNYVVVDGSNLATEGRSLPSLTQLEEAVIAYQEEHTDVSMVVVVDATFEHRIAEAERPRLKEAELHGEVVAPPAGTIGRGDVFILKIADRQQAVVLSNDSFQEFHGDFPWLFDEGRLVGGKPVPGVGWIFTERTPVRGPKKRSSGQRPSAPVKPVKKLSVSRPDGSKPKVGDVLIPNASAKEKKVRAYDLAKEFGIDTKALQQFATTHSVAIASHATALATEEAEQLRVAYDEKKIRAYELAKELELDTKGLKALAKKVSIEIGSHSSTLSEREMNSIRALHDRNHLIEEVKESLEIKPLRPQSEQRGRGGAAKGKGRGTKEPRLETSASNAKKTPADSRKAASTSKQKATGAAAKRKSGSTAANQPLDFVAFLSSHKVGSKVAGDVVSFTSHGAMIDVELSEGTVFHCYVRTATLGDPPPQRARDALNKGERYNFVVKAIDAARRVAEVELAPKASPRKGKKA